MNNSFTKNIKFIDSKTYAVEFVNTNFYAFGKNDDSVAHFSQ